MAENRHIDGQPHSAEFVPMPDNYNPELGNNILHAYGVVKPPIRLTEKYLNDLTNNGRDADVRLYRGTDTKSVLYLGVDRDIYSHNDGLYLLYTMLNRIVTSANQIENGDFSSLT
jgi:hypothetical protein